MIRTTAIVWVCCYFYISSGYAQTASLPEPLRNKLQAAIKHEVDQKRLPAFSMAIVDREDTVWSFATGLTDPKSLDSSKTGSAKQRPLDQSTIYRVGSVSKLFTDLAIMQLVEQAQLDLDKPVQTYLPDFAPSNEFGGDITLRQLMSHRAGLVREPPVGHYFDPNEPSLASTVQSLNDTSLVYKPDTRTKYSNAGISVVGAVLEKISGRLFDQQIKFSILDPLAMHSSTFRLSEPDRQRLAPATMWTLEGRRFPAPQFILGTAPAGNLYSTVDDLTKFIRCINRQGKLSTDLDAKNLLQAATLEQMLTPGKNADGSPQNFALGFRVRKLDGHRQVGHGGAVYGCATQLEILPDDHLGVAAAAALDCANSTVEKLCDYALRLMLAARAGQSLPEYDATTDVPAQRAAAIVGTYQSDDQQLAWVEVDYVNSQLTLRHKSSVHQVKQLQSSGQWIIDDPLENGLKVEPTNDGHLRIGDQLFKRLPEQCPEPPKPQWEALIGEYGWDHDILFILEDHGRLVALIEWFYAYPLQEIGPDEFAFPDYGLYHGERLKFIRDAQGRVTQATAAGVPFKRRDLNAEGETFKIQPVRPLEELRREALKATPPIESGNFRDSQLVELVKLNPNIKLDVRYATTNNFAGSIFYTQERAFLQEPAAAAVARVHERLKDSGYGLLIHDAYRPWAVTKMFWDATPDTMKDFVANPQNGSRHNRGCAVDLSMYHLASGKPVTMVSGYDEFSPRAYPGYPGGTSQQRWHRRRLRQAMEREGFTVYEVEWWHFDYKDWRQYRIGNTTFEEMK